PVIALTAVVLPEPLGPTRPKISPRLMSIETPFNACNPPNQRLISMHDRTMSRFPSGTTGCIVSSSGPLYVDLVIIMRINPQSIAGLFMLFGLAYQIYGEMPQVCMGEIPVENVWT